MYKKSGTKIGPGRKLLNVLLASGLSGVFGTAAMGIYTFLCYMPQFFLSDATFYEILAATIGVVIFFGMYIFFILFLLVLPLSYPVYLLRIPPKKYTHSMALGFIFGCFIITSILLYSRLESGRLLESAYTFFYKQISEFNYDNVMTLVLSGIVGGAFVGFLNWLTLREEKRQQDSIDGNSIPSME